MIVAFDIETVPNPDMLDSMPEPRPKMGNVKDPVKVAAKIAEAKEKQVEKMALDGYTGRIVCASFVSAGKRGSRAVTACDDGELQLIEWIFKFLGNKETRLVTWNGIGFDLPFVYKRCMMLGISPARFGAPPLSAWTRRYNTEKHYDLMAVCGNWSEYIALDDYAKMILGESKIDIDYKTFPELVKTEDGRKKLEEYCLQDSRLTYRLFERMQGTLFA